MHVIISVLWSVKERMSVDLCDPRSSPLSEREVKKIPCFQRAMRSTFGAFVFGLFAFAVGPLILVYVGGAMSVLLWCGLVQPLSVRLFVDYCFSRFYYLLVVSESLSIHWLQMMIPFSAFLFSSACLVSERCCCPGMDFVEVEYLPTTSTLMKSTSHKINWVYINCTWKSDELIL